MNKNRAFIVIFIILVLTQVANAQEKDLMGANYPASIVTARDSGTIQWRYFWALHKESKNQFGGSTVNLSYLGGNIARATITRDGYSCFGHKAIGDTAFYKEFTKILESHSDLTAMFKGPMFNIKSNPDFTEFEWILILKRKSNNPFDEFESRILEAINEMVKRHHKD